MASALTSNDQWKALNMVRALDPAVISVLDRGYDYLVARERLARYGLVELRSRNAARSRHQVHRTNSHSESDGLSRP